MWKEKLKVTYSEVYVMAFIVAENKDRPGRFAIG